MKKILVLDDNLTICLMLKSWLVKQNYQAETATSVEEAKQKVKNEAYDLILSDIRMPESDGFSFLSWIKKFDSDILVIMMTGFADIESAVDSMKAGAVDYIAKPIDPELLYKKIADALKNQENQKKIEQIREYLIKPPGEVYKKIFDKLNEVVHTDSHLLVIGEQGTDKTAVAKYIYSKNRNDSRPFVTLDCDPQEINLIGEHLDCEQKIVKLLDKAKGGLLLIKNIQKTDINTQTLLLKVLTTQKKDKSFTQIIITTKDNREQLRAGLLPKLSELLEESYIELPALKGDKDAILFYTNHFIDSANRELDTNIKKIDNEVLSEFFKHPWKGNVQELKNLIFKACLLTEGSTISKEILPELFNDFSALNSETSQAAEQVIQGLKKENYEKEKIREALEITKGNKTMAASILNIDRKTLYNKMKLYKVEIN